MSKSFVHLHVHTDYSFQDGVTKVAKIVHKAAKLKMPAIALTDHGYLHGAIDFYTEAKAAGVKPIIGVEAYIVPGSYLVKNSEEEVRYHVTLLAMNKKGYHNLIKLMTIAATDGFYRKPRIDKTLMAEYSEGLICLTGCLEGEVHVNLYDNERKGRRVDLNKASTVLGQYRDIFGDRLYMEFMYHGLKAQAQQLENAILLSKKHNVRVVATNDSHYVDAEDWKLRDIVMCDMTYESTKFTLNDPRRTLCDKEGEYYLKSPEEMYGIWHGEDSEFVTNTLRIADMVEDYDVGLNDGYRLPKFRKAGGTDTIFNEKITAGFKDKYPNATVAERERLDHEVKVIGSLGFKDYFLILEDIIDYCLKNSIPVGPGRGSAAGSIVSYCLGITTLCPIKHGLLFERFLNPGRKSLPDIDIDVCRGRRGEIIRYIQDKYGKDSVAQIITFSRMKGKGTIRAIGKVLGVPEETIEELASMMPPDAQEFTVTLNQIVNGDAEVPKRLVDSFANFRAQNQANSDFIDACVRLEGVYRSSGIHAAGVVIGPEPLKNFMPLKRTPNDDVVTQFSMEEVEALGALKFDLLALDTLTMEQACLSSIMKDNPSGPLKDTKISNIRDFNRFLKDKNDPLVFERTFTSGKTVGVFQCDSTGLRELLVRMKASSYADIAVAIALYRPGPIDSGIVDSFIRRRHKLEPETVWIEAARKFLDETHGLPIYQEQIMFVSQALCGFSLQEADDLRRVIGKKKKEDIAKFRDKFVKAAVAVSKISEASANDIYDDIEKYGRYAFNKSHSYAYADICYETAWLKSYYPAYFMCGLLNKFVAFELDRSHEVKVSKKKDDEKFLIYLYEAISMGLKLASPDISLSPYEFTPNGDIVAFGLGSIKGIGPKLKDLIVYRDKIKGFKTLPRLVYAMIKCGLSNKTLKDLIAVNAVNIGVSSDELQRQSDGYRRPCRCVMTRGAPKPECKLCRGEGLGKTLRNIFDDVKTALASMEDLPEEHILTRLDTINVPSSNEPMPMKLLASPNIYALHSP